MKYSINNAAWKLARFQFEWKCLFPWWYLPVIVYFCRNTQWNQILLFIRKSFSISAKISPKMFLSTKFMPFSLVMFNSGEIYVIFLSRQNISQHWQFTDKVVCEKNPWCFIFQSERERRIYCSNTWKRHNIIDHIFRGLFIASSQLNYNYMLNIYLIV